MTDWCVIPSGINGVLYVFRYWDEFMYVYIISLQNTGFHMIWVQHGAFTLSGAVRYLLCELLTGHKYRIKFI